jgi:hypothetical protein
MEEINIIVAPCTACKSSMIVEDAWIEDRTGIIEARCTDAECGEIVLIKVRYDNKIDSSVFFGFLAISQGDILPRDE